MPHVPWHTDDTGGSTDSPTTKEFPDGSVRQWNPETKTWDIIFEAPGQPTVSGTTAPDAPYYLRDPRTEFTTPAGSQEALMAALAGYLGPLDAFNVLAPVYGASTARKLSGLEMLAGDDGGGGGSGVGWAQLAQRQAEFAYQQQQDRVASAIQELAAIGEQQALQDARARAMQAAQLSALPYAVSPGQTHFTGFGPSSPLVNYGLTEAIPIQHTQFNPQLPANPYDQQYQEALNVVHQLAGLP